MSRKKEKLQQEDFYGEREHKFIDPKYDVAFRRLFGSNSPIEIAMSLLNAVLELPEGKKIVKITRDDSHRGPGYAMLKTSVQDFLCTDSEGRKYLVELQRESQMFFEERLLFYFSKLYYEQIDRGDAYAKLCGVYIIGIVNFNLYPQRPHWKTDLVITAKDDHERLMPHFATTVIELSKFEKTEKECKTALDHWIFFFKQSERMKDVPKNVDDPWIKRAYECIDQFNWSVKEKKVYDDEEKAARDKAGIEASKLSHAKAVGLAEGLAEAQILIAKKMLAQGLDHGLISSTTGLELAEIKKLAEKV